MAGFELAQRRSAGGMAREWRPVRYLPLYLAGIAAGAGIGLGLSIYHSDHPAVQAYAGASAPAMVVPVADGAVPDVPVVTAGPLDPEPIDVAPVVPVAAVVPPVSPVAVAVAERPNVPAAPPAPPPAPVGQAVVPSAPSAAPVAATPVAAQPVPASPPAAANPPAAAPASPGFYVPAIRSGGPSTLEQQLFDGINAERSKAGLAPYVLDAGLTKVARTRSQQMADQNYFAHTDPSGRTMYTALLAYFGYTSYAWAGENLAMNSYGSGEAAGRAVISLMNSPTHRDNLLASDFFRIGIGEVTTTDGRHIFTMIFLG